MTIVITGWGWRTPLGDDVDAVLRRLGDGESAVRANRRFDAGSYACSVAACLPQAPKPAREQRFLRRTGLFAIEAAVEAMAAAGESGSERVGLFFGYGGLRAHWDDLMPAFEQQQPGGGDAWTLGLKRLHPFWMLQNLSNNAHAIAAQRLGARGEGNTYGGANAGAQAIGGAVRALDDGAVDVALVVGYDSWVEPEVLVTLAHRNVLSHDPAGRWAAPYQSGSRGCAPGEAAAALVLCRAGESEAPAIASITAADGADGESGEARIETLARIAANLAQAGDAVDGAGIAWPPKDAAERLAIAEYVGADATLGCLASAFGQLGAATAPVQAIALAASLRRGLLPPIAGLRAASDGPLRPLIAAEPTRCRAALGVAIGAPGLVGAVRVALP